MKLSIITINYNNAEGLRKTLASVAAQTYANIEHIIVDGASTDGSVEVIREYENQLNITHSTIHILWSSEPDNGIYNAMNKGIEIALGKRVINALNRSELAEDKNKGRVMGTNSFNRSELVEDKNKGREMDVNAFNRSERSEDKNRGIRKATGEYVQILNSGDLLAAPDVTERMMAALNDKKIGILYGNMIRDFGNGKYSKDVCLGERVKNREVRAQEVEWTMDDFIKGTVNHDPTYIHWSLYEKYGLYDDGLKIVSDWKWFVNAVVFGGEKLYYVPIDVTIFDTTGISETNLAAREKERRTELENMLPSAILKDYDRYHFPILQYKRLKKYYLWGFVYFIERVLFKFEKWRMLK